MSSGMKQDFTAQAAGLWVLVETEGQEYVRLHDVIAGQYSWYLVGMHKLENVQEPYRLERLEKQYQERMEIAGQQIDSVLNLLNAQVGGPTQ